MSTKGTKRLWMWNRFNDRGTMWELSCHVFWDCHDARIKPGHWSTDKTITEISVVTPLFWLEVQVWPLRRVQKFGDVPLFQICRGNWWRSADD